jgi:ligand-binding sensor domain-containing protein
MDLRTINSNQTFAYSLFLIMFYFTSCNELIKTQPQESVNNKSSGNVGLPKLIKSQGSSEFDNVQCGLQDKDGNLWFGTTREGVYRYDGKSFTQFTVNDGLAHHTVLSILEDKAGKIWFGTGDGICYFDEKKFTALQIPDSITVEKTPDTTSYNNTYVNDEVWSMMQDSKGIIWFGTKKGVYCYDGNLFSRFLDKDDVLNKDGLRLKMVSSILEDKNGMIWFGSGMPPGMEGLCRYDGKSVTGFKPKGNGWVRRIIEEEKGNLLLVTRHAGVCRYDGKTVTNITEQAGIDNGSVWSLLKDKAGTLWIGTELGSGQLGEDGGLWRLDGKSATKFTTKDGLCHNGVSCIIEDKAGNIWIGTRNVGLCRYDGKTFTNFTE